MLVKLLDIGVRDRFRQDVGNLEELAKDFRETGQITPITIRKSSDDDKAEGFNEPFMLVAGGRRYAAAMMNGWEEIKAYTFEELPPLERLIMELHENTFKKDMTWQEIVDLRARIHELRLLQNPKHQAHETAKELKVAPDSVYKDLRLAEAMKANPGLSKAGSKKAAVRMMEMESHIKKVSAQTDRGLQKVTEIQSCLHTADSRDFLNGVEPGSIDLVYSDPPWGIDYFSQGHKSVREGDESLALSEYDDSLETTQDLIVDVLPKMIRALKDTGWLVLHCGYDAYIQWRRWIEDICGQCCEYSISCSCDSFEGLKPEPIPWIWYKPNANNRSRYPDRHEDNQYEFLLVTNRGGAKLFRQHQGNVLVHNAEYGSRIHSMQKPVSVCMDIVSRFTLPGMTVLDPFFGSGALLAGAAATQRKIIGCEKNEAMLLPAVGLIIKEIK